MQKIENEKAIEEFCDASLCREMSKRPAISSYLDGELEAMLYFHYDGQKIPASSQHNSIYRTCRFICHPSGFWRAISSKKSDHRRSFPRFYFQCRTRRFYRQVGKENRRVHDRYHSAKSTPGHIQLSAKLARSIHLRSDAIYPTSEPYISHRYL